MAEHIIIEANEVWEYFNDQFEELKDAMHMIAEHKEYGIEIYLANKDGFPELTVEADGVEMYTETVLNEKDCESTVKEIYDTYLTDKVISKMLEDSGDDDEEDTVNMEIEAREDELSAAVFDCIDVFCDGAFEYYEEMEEICEDFKDLICLYLFIKWGLEPRRPMVIEFDDGSESYEEYPYSSLDLEEEEKNPLFMQ